MMSRKDIIYYAHDDSNERVYITLIMYRNAAHLQQGVGDDEQEGHEEGGHQGGLACGAHQAAGNVAPRVEGGRLEHGEEGAAEGAVELVGARARLVAVVLARRVGEELHGEDGVDGLEDEHEREGVEHLGHRGEERLDEAQQGGDPLEEAEDADGADATKHLRPAADRGEEEPADHNKGVEPVPPIPQEIEEECAKEVEEKLDREYPVKKIADGVEHIVRWGSVGGLHLSFGHGDHKACSNQRSRDQLTCGALIPISALPLESTKI